VSILALVLTIVASALAALSATADGALLALDARPGLPAPLDALYARRERAHRALAFARVLSQLGAGMAFAVALALNARAFWQIVVIGAVGSLVLVGLSETVARAAGDVGSTHTARRLYPVIVTVERLLAPVVALGAALDNALHRLLPPNERHEERRDATAEQFRQIVAAEADVTKEQQVLLNGVFRLGDTEVHEVMVPRVDIVALDRETPWSEVVDKLRSSEHARLPVYADSIDNVIGILYAKDLLPAVLADVPPADGWTGLVRPATFIPGAKKADLQLREFQASGTHIAIVVDEFGGTAGLITIEDVLEEIVGDIRDEYDVEEAAVEQEGGRRFWVSARLTLAELSELLQHDFQREDVTTVGGLVYELLGRVPKAGEEFVIEGFRVVVERVERRRVRRVYFERLDHEETAA
jgi:putative hemolysin